MLDYIFSDTRFDYVYTDISVFGLYIPLRRYYRQFDFKQSGIFQIIIYNNFKF